MNKNENEDGLIVCENPYRPKIDQPEAKSLRALLAEVLDAYGLAGCATDVLYGFHDPDEFLDADAAIDVLRKYVSPAPHTSACLRCTSEYMDGANAFWVNGVRCDNVFTGEVDYDLRIAAWYQGYDDAKAARNRG